MNHIRTAHCNTLHPTFCSPLSSLELFTAIPQLSTSTSSGPDQITYPLLSHLPQSALHFLLYIFNLSWSKHTFPSTWKQSTIIPILKSGKPSDPPSSYRTIALTSCTFKLFKRMILGRLTYFLEHKTFSHPCKLVLDLVDRLWIRFSFSHSQSQIPSINLIQAHVQSLPLWILRKLLTQFGTLPFSLNSSH